MVAGAAVGVVSVIGYTPDLFVKYIGVVLLDRAPVLKSHQHYLWFVSVFAAIGLITSLAPAGFYSAIAKRASPAGLPGRTTGS